MELISNVEAQVCMDHYIFEVAKSKEYKTAYTTLQNTAFYDSTDNFETVGSIDEYKIDSMILFNRAKDSCCGFVLVIGNGAYPAGMVFNFIGIQSDKKWIFKEGFSITFRNDKPLSFAELSKSIRVDMALDGFIKNRDCEVNWDYIRKHF